MTRTSTPVKPGQRDSIAGQSVVEFAMVIPMIMLLILGALDLGRAVYTYNTLAQAAREGNRVAIVNQVATDVRSRAIASAASLGLTSSNVDVCFKTSATSQRSCASPATDNCPQATRSIGCLAIVTARLSYQPMTPVVGLIWSTISLSSTSISPIEHVCPTIGSTCQ